MLNVNDSKNIFKENQVSFDEREKQLKKEEHLEQEQLKRKRNSPYKSFVQLNKDTYNLEDKLMQENPLAYRIWRFLANNMDNYNAVIVSQETLTEIFDVSKTTIWRAIKVLRDGNYIKTYRTGGSNIYALNDKMVWNSWGNNLKYSKFGANVILSESEQPKDIKRSINDLKAENHKEIKFK